MAISRAHRNHGLETNPPSRRPSHSLPQSLVGHPPAGVLVRLSPREDWFLAGQSRILSLQRSRYTQSASHPPCSGYAVVATLRILQPLSPYISGPPHDATACADRARRCPSAHSFLDAGRLSLRVARLPHLYVRRRRSSPRSLHAPRRPAGSFSVRLDPLASRPLLEIDRRRRRHRLCR